MLRIILILALLIGTRALSQEIDTRELGTGYAHLLGLAAEPEIAASSLDIDGNSPKVKDVTLKGMRLPYYHEFGAGDAARWFAQGSLGYLDFEEKTVLPLPDGSSFSIQPRWQAYTGMAEGGYIWPLGNGFAIAPSLSLGVSRLENDVDFSDPALGELLLQNLDGTVFNWSSNAVIGRGHLALKYDQRHGAYRLKGGAHLSYAHVDSYSESSRFDGFEGESGTGIINLDISRRINSEQAERPVYLIGHLGTTHFLGSDSDSLGFEFFHEIGASIGIGKYAAGILGVFGDDVDGWNLTFNYNY